MLKQIGKYEVIKELGRGGMGFVYEGLDTLIERRVAIKTLNKAVLDVSESDYIINRFRQEARAAGRLSHPNILSIYDYGEESEISYIVMELSAGVSLQEHLMSKKGITLNEIVRITLKILGALCYAHEKGVVHRDIKPHNIMIDNSGEIKIADFGLAKVDSTVMTQLGRIQGSPAYMSPEQYLSREVDGRSDLYSVAVILYEMLTGTRPYKGNNLVEMMMQVMKHSPSAPSAISAMKLPADIDLVVKKAMSKHPENRYKTAREFAVALKKAAFSSPQEIPVAHKHEKNVQDVAVKSVTKLADLSSEERKEFDNVLTKINNEFENYINGTGAHAKFDPEAYKVAASNDVHDKSGKQKIIVPEINSKDPEKKLHHALEKTFHFFNSFKDETDMIRPTFDRAYKLDNFATISNLIWKNVKIDLRRQSAYDDANISFVSVNLMLEMQDPVIVKRPWYEADSLQTELRNYNLDTEENIELLSRYRNKPWLEVNLKKEFTVKLLFKGNYKTNEIEFRSQNLNKLGHTIQNIPVEQLTDDLIENIGMMLLGIGDEEVASTNQENEHLYMDNQDLQYA